jgi:hypothetical protein
MSLVCIHIDICYYTKWLYYNDTYHQYLETIYLSSDHHFRVRPTSNYFCHSPLVVARVFPICLFVSRKSFNLTITYFFYIIVKSSYVQISICHAIILLQLGYLYLFDLMETLGINEALVILTQCSPRNYFLGTLRIW